MGTISHLKLMAMLDSLRSMLTKETVDGFWTHWRKMSQVDKLLIEEMIYCLKEALEKPKSQQKQVKHQYHTCTQYKYGATVGP